MRASNAVSKTYGSTIFQRMWRNGHERTRNDTHCDPALAADISDVNDGRVRHFVTERLTVLLCTPPLAPSSPTCRGASSAGGRGHDEEDRRRRRTNHALGVTEHERRRLTTVVV